METPDHTNRPGGCPARTGTPYHPAEASRSLDHQRREVVAAKPEVVVTQEYTVYAMQRIQAPVPVVFGFSGDSVDRKLVRSCFAPIA